MSSLPDDECRLAAVREVLTSGQQLGMLGDRPIDDVIEHAGAFVNALRGVSGAILDLGSGAGVPGLVIAARRPDLRVVLLDRRTARTDFLERQVRRLGWSSQIEVVAADASSVRRTFAAAVARGFGTPEVTAATGASLLEPGGLLIVSQPPGGRTWSRELLRAVGLRHQAHEDARVAVFVRIDDNGRGFT